MVEEGYGGFLPPRPAGPEPELGARPAPATPPEASPVPGAGWAPPAGAAPPPGGPQAPPWTPAPAAQGPDNGAAVTGFVLSLVAGGLLVISAGLSSVVSIGCAIAGIVYGRRGMRRVDAGETNRNRGLAQAGFWIGIASLVLAVLATLFWILFAVLAATDDEFLDDLERELDESGGGSLSALRVGVVATRATLGVLA